MILPTDGKCRAKKKKAKIINSQARSQNRTSVLRIMILCTVQEKDTQTQIVAGEKQFYKEQKSTENSQW